LLPSKIGLEAVVVVSELIGWASARIAACVTGEICWVTVESLLESVVVTGLVDVPLRLVEVEEVESV